MVGGVIAILAFLVAGSIALGCLAFWIWMLIDALNNEPSEGNDKIIWILVIVLAQVVGAAIYFFVRRPDRIAKFGR